MKISIVTASYNSCATIEDTIKSVLSQTYHDIEYIVVDGASKDGTMDIVRKYEPMFNGRMKWVSEKDKGIYDAMNKGIRLASGDVVGLLNSDDFYKNNDVIERVANEFEKDLSLDCTFADLCFVDKTDTSKIVRYYSGKNWKPSKLRFGQAPPHPTFYCKRELYEKYGYYRLDYQIAADHELLTRFLLVNGIKYKYIPMNMICMRVGGESTKNWHNVLIVNNKEQVKACRDNGVNTCLFNVMLKYFPKVWNLIFHNKSK